MKTESFPGQNALYGRPLEMMIISILRNSENDNDPGITIDWICGQILECDPGLNSYLDKREIRNLKTRIYRVINNLGLAGMIEITKGQNSKQGPLLLITKIDLR